MQKKKHYAETCDVADQPNFRLFQQKNVRNLEKNTFFKIISKNVYISFMCVYFWTLHSLLRIFFCKTYLGNELHSKKFCYNISLLKFSLYMIVNIFCLSGWEIFAGVCNTDAREKFIWTWCRPEHPKFMFSSYFVSPGRLLLEGKRAFHSQILCCLPWKMSHKMLFLQDKCLKQNY